MHFFASLWLGFVDKKFPLCFFVKGGLTMSRYLWCAALASVAMCFSLVVGSGCDMGAKPIRPNSVNPKTAAKAAVDQYGKDGSIAGDDLKKCPAIQDGLARIDKNGDGIVSVDELADEIKAWGADGTGRIIYAVKINHKGQPLAGAAVKFVPEKFLGTGFVAAEGTTDGNGVAALLIPGATPPGLAPAFYRVEVTKGGENIPAIYNTETTLGLDVAHGVMGVGHTFDLTY
jgi:hypothetical protein